LSLARLPAACHPASSSLPSITNTRKDRRRFTEIAAKFLSEVERELYMVGAGRKEQLELAAIFERYPGLFSHETTQALLHERTSGSEPTVARYLAAFAADGYLENTVKTLSEEITNEELAATVEWDGEELPYRQVSSVLGQEPDPTRRHDLYQRQMAVTRRQHGQRMERMGRLHQEARSLGFSGYAELYDDLKGLQLSTLSQAMSQLLSATEAAYSERLEYVLATAHVEPGSADVSDIVYCFRAARATTSASSWTSSPGPRSHRGRSALLCWCPRKYTW